MSLINQIKNSQFSKQGGTNPTGVFEGTPQNAAIVQRGYSVPDKSVVLPVTQNPIDVTFNSRRAPTYLEFLQSAKK